MRFETNIPINGWHITIKSVIPVAVIINNSESYITILTNANKFYKPK